MSTCGKQRSRGCVCHDVSLQPVPDKHALLFGPTIATIRCACTDAATRRSELRSPMRMRSAGYGTLDREGFQAREATAEECARRFVRRCTIVQDARAMKSISCCVRQSAPLFSEPRRRDYRIAKCGTSQPGLKDDLRLWTTILGAHVSDRAGDVTICVRPEASSYRTLSSTGRNCLCGLRVESMDAIMQSNYLFRSGR